jgi:hypothetical protein
MGYDSRVIPHKELLDRADRDLESATSPAEYLRIWRAKDALGYPTRRTARQPSQAELLRRRTVKRNRKR